MFFIQFLGTHGSGKTTCSKHIGQCLEVRFTPGDIAHENPNKTCLLLGKCSNSGKFTGMDGYKATQEQRFQLIHKYWNSPHKLIIVDGSMLITWSSFFSRYRSLPKHRKVWGIWLMADNNVIKTRLEGRGRTNWTKKKARHVRSKRRGSEYVFENGCEVPHYRMERVINHTPEQFYRLMKKISRVTGLTINCDYDFGSF